MMTNANMKNGLRNCLVGPLGIRTDKGLKVATTIFEYCTGAV